MNTQQTKPARWGPACGIAFVVLLAAGIFVQGAPSTNKSPAYILAWYNVSSHKRQIGIGVVLTNIAVVLGLFWFGYLRDRFGRTDLGARLSPVLLVGAGIFATGGLIFNGAIFALLDQPKHMLPATAQTLNFMQSDLGAAALVVGVSVLTAAAGIIIVRTRVLPAWLGWVSLVIAVVGLAGPLGFFAFLAMGVWVLILSGFFWRDEARLARVGQDLPASA